MDNATYHADTSAISASGLKLFMRSPAHYYAAYLDPNRVERKQTPAKLLGTATHCALLEPMEFHNRFCATPDINKNSTVWQVARNPEGFAAMPDGMMNTKQGKELKQEIETSGKIAVEQAKYDEGRKIFDLISGRELLSKDDIDSIAIMSDAFHANRQTAAIFSKPHSVEQSIYATINGVSCKCRPDFITSDGLMVMDVKTTSDASPEGFGRSAWNLGYHVQAAFYRRVISAATGTTPDFVFGCVESDRPHLVAYYSVPQYLLDYADGLIDCAIERYAECLASGIWPGYVSEIEMQELTVPGFAQRIIENDGIDEWEISHV